MQKHPRESNVAAKKSCAQELGSTGTSVVVSGLSQAADFA